MSTYVLVCMGVFLIMIFGILRLQGTRKELEHTGETFLQDFASDAQTAELLSERDGTLSLRSVDTGKEIYRIGDPEERFFLGNWALAKKGGERRLLGRYRTTILVYGASCKAEFVFDCTKDGREIVAETAWFALWYVVSATVAVAAIYLVTRTTLLSASRLSDRVNKMTLQNLHSNRLDTEMTEAELRELAEGIALGGEK